MKLRKTAVFIDGASLHHAARALQIEIDFKRLRHALGTEGNVVSIEYHTIVPPGDDYSSLRPLLDWLDYNGFKVNEKVGRYDGATRLRGSISLNLAVSALQYADKVDQIILFSGDGDLQALVAALQRKGVMVTVVSTTATKPAMVADELRRQADRFIDLLDLAPLLVKNCAAPPRTMAAQ